MQSATSTVGVVAEQEIEPMSLLRAMVKDEEVDVEDDVFDDLPTSKSVWNCLPASAKAMRTTNPIRAIVDPIVASISLECGCGGRADDKSHISLAVRNSVFGMTKNYPTVGFLWSLRPLIPRLRVELIYLVYIYI